MANQAVTIGFLKQQIDLLNFPRLYTPAKACNSLPKQLWKNARTQPLMIRLKNGLKAGFPGTYFKPFLFL
jgi:hypothetical protein